MGDKLRQWVNDQLNKSGWSISELARRGEINQSYISAILNGRQNPGPKFYQGVARAFGVTLESVERLEKTGDPPKSRIDDPAYLGLIEIAQSLADDDLRDVLDYATYKLKKSKQ